MSVSPPYVEDGQVVSGPVAAVLGRMWPRAESVRRLERLGFRGERAQAPILTTLDGIARAGAAWAAKAEASPAGSGEAPSGEAVLSSEAMESEMIGTAEVAGLLRLSPRRIRQVAGELGGRKVGGRLVFDRAVVLAHVADRREAA